MSIWNMILIGVYFSASFLLLLYACNCYVLLFLFSRKKSGKTLDIDFSQYREDEIPYITTQIPVFNEYNVALRAIRAAAKMKWAEGKHEVQVLDDSTDSTYDLIKEEVEKLNAEGYDVSLLHRDNRQGFKAGALHEGLKVAKGEYIAVFDADFVPTEDFLLKTVEPLMKDPNLGLVQARWGHLNRSHSLITRAQAIGIDGHFIIEQSARTFNNLYMNFNGTAGLWRKKAIDEGGGWQWDTLTEDLDLSYRVQLANWQTCYLPDVVVPAEIPEDVIAFKNQQFRWAKGSIQSGMKLLPRIFKSDASWFKKLQSVFHMTHYMVHPLMLISVLASPGILQINTMQMKTLAFFVTAVLILATLAPNILYFVSQFSTYDDWKKRIVYLPALIMVGVGLAVNNSRAVYEALIRRESGFVRTPKRGNKESMMYKLKLSPIVLVEIVLGVYASFVFYSIIAAGSFSASPIMALYTSGFLFIGIMSFLHSRGIGRGLSGS